MRIAIVSDTHGNAANFKKVVSWLNTENIRFVLHCGDIGSPESLKESLTDFKGDFFGVFGNTDKEFNVYVTEYGKIPNVKIKEETLELELGGEKMALNHFPSQAKKLALSGKYDTVFYGHTHRAWQERINKCQMVNPGELAGQFFKPTFAVYNTETKDLQLKILESL